MQKILLLVSLPIFIIILLSISNTNQNYNTTQEYKNEFHKLTIMQSINELVHNLQIERGISSILIHSKQNNNIKNKLQTYVNQTDLSILKLQQVSKKLNINQINKIKELRVKVQNNNNISFKDMFETYSEIINKLMLILNSYKITTDLTSTNIYIFALHKVISYQEYSGQERALVSSIATAQQVTKKELELLHNILHDKKQLKKELLTLLNGEFNKTLNEIEKEYSTNFYQITLDEILSYEKKSLLLDKIFEIIGYGGMTYHLYMYQQTKREIYFEKYLKDKVHFDKLIKEYISLTRPWSKERGIAQKISQIFFYVSRTNPIVNNNKNLKLFNTLKNTKLYLNAEAWFTVSTKKINDINKLENRLFREISKSLNNTIQNAQYSLIKQMFLSLLSIIVLIVGSFVVAKNIKFSITQLQKGTDEFFKFLNF